MTERVKHVKRKSTYEVVGRGCIQTHNPLGDNAKVVIYKAESDGSLWVRPVDEFDDPERFEKLPDPMETIKKALMRVSIYKSGAPFNHQRDLEEIEDILGEAL